jgi:cyclopropane-fatty-acyl-phospholipid synthase
MKDVLGGGLPIAVRAWDGSRVGPDDAPATIVLRSPDALRRIVFAPGELGFSRAWVAGDIDVEGDIVAAMALRERVPDLKLRLRHLLAAARIVGLRNLRPLKPPAEEVRRLPGRLHSRARDAAAISYHYDAPNSFYELVLGPAMAYTCALFERPGATLEEAQAAKFDLVCRKLALAPGMRVLDVGCGWGSLAIHMASRYAVRVTGVTLSRRQVEYATKRISAEGVAHLVDVRHQDYRDVDDGPYDAVSAVGILEHVGTDLPAYPRAIFGLVKPGGRFLHHSIGLPPHKAARAQDRPFIWRYVWPDGDLNEVGAILTALQSAGLEVRHVESLRDHYGSTLRAWLANLEANWEEAVRAGGLARARIWRLYMAAGALNFEANRVQVHQMLAVRPDDGRSGLPPRPDW